jgi:hypothetical protein
LPAARIPGLSFPVKRVPFSIWLKRNAIVLTVVLSATLALIIAPTWYVLALNANRETRYKLQNTDVIGRGESSEVVNAALTDSPQDFLNQNRQELFDLVHPQGIAKRVIVHDVEFKWKHGRATHRTEDVEQVVVTFTLYWEGPIEKDGFTKMRMTYDNESKRWISTEVLSTNGFTKKDVGEVMVGLMGFAIDKWVQYQAEKAAAQ